MAATSIESGTSTLRHHECVGRAAAAVAAKPAGLEIALESQDAGYAAGDPANMVAGSLERRLAAETVTCEMSLPSTARVEGPRDLIETRCERSQEMFRSAVWEAVGRHDCSREDIEQQGLEPKAADEQSQREIVAREHARMSDLDTADDGAAEGRAVGLSASPVASSIVRQVVVFSTSSRNMERRLLYTFGGCTNGWAAQ